MKFKLIETLSLDLQPQLQWLFYSEKSKSFVSGDEAVSFAVPVNQPGQPQKLEPFRQYDPKATHQFPCNLPVPLEIYDEFAANQWCGFRFLKTSDYDDAVDNEGQYRGDMLRTLVFGPNYGHYVQHPGSGLVISLRSGSMEMFCRQDSGFLQLDSVRTRGKAALAFAAHPRESLLAYGDNYGNFHSHAFDESGFRKAKKIASKSYKASRLQFLDEGKLLLTGGAGYLCAYSYQDGKYTQLHELSIAVRDFLWFREERMVF
ncbi:MAG: hypothetical protein GY757_50760, partial [bacterium]|nr:hypothetical protein [bacterium]